MAHVNNSTASSRTNSFVLRGLFHQISKKNHSVVCLSQARKSTSYYMATNNFIEISRKIISQWDPSGLGAVTIDSVSSATKIDKRFIESLFQSIDVDKSGNISEDELIQILRILVNGLKCEKLDLLIRFADRDGDGIINLEDAQFSIINSINKNIFGSQKHPENSESGDSHAINVEIIRELFLANELGDYAINYFCERILNILLGISKLADVTKQKSIFIHDSTIKNNLLFINLSKYQNLSRPTQFAISLSFLQLGLFFYQFILVYYFENLNIFGAIAHGFGINLRIVTLLVYASMTRSLLAKLNGNAILRPLIPLGCNVDVHSYLGYALLLHSFGHTIAHIILAQQIFPLGIWYRFIQPCLLNGTWRKSSGLVYGDGISGTLLLLLITLFAITAILRGISSYKYWIFTTLHSCHLLWPIMIMLHVPYLLSYMIFIILLFLGERLYDFSYLTIHSTLIASRPGSHGISCISVKQIGNCVPGTYYRLKVPALSYWEWHPFSLAGGTSSDRLTFFVASVGDWTRGLHELVSSPNRGQYSIQVQGPFFAPASFATRESRMLAVASGVGITPFFSIMATHVNNQQIHEFDLEVFYDMFGDTLPLLGGGEGGGNFESTTTGDILSYGIHHNARRISKSVFNGMNATFPISPTTTTTTTTSSPTLPTLHVIWSIREVEEMLFYFHYIRNLLKLQTTLKYHRVKIDVYLTGIGSSSDPKYMMTQTLLFLGLSGFNHDFMKIHFGRPDLGTIITSERPQECYYCGGGILREAVLTTCHQHNVKFYSEDFDSGGSFLSKLGSVWRSVTRKRRTSSSSSLMNTIDQRSRRPSREVLLSDEKQKHVSKRFLSNRVKSPVSCMPEDALSLPLPVTAVRKFSITRNSEAVEHAAVTVRRGGIPVEQGGQHEEEEEEAKKDIVVQRGQQGSGNLTDPSPLLFKKRDKDKNQE